MSAITPEYLHEEYANAFGNTPASDDWMGTVKRVTIAALPLVGLHKPIGSSLSVVMGGVRSITSLSALSRAIENEDIEQCSYALFQTVLSVVSVGCTLFAHPVGLLLTTANDLATEIYHLSSLLQEEDKEEEIQESLVKIVNLTLYLALFATGSIEATIVSLAWQVVTGIFQAYREQAQGGKEIECAGHLLLTVARIVQLHGQTERLNAKWELEKLLEELQIPQTFIPGGKVGELGAQWDFPSDHLPVGAQVGNARILSWNVLNTRYMSHITGKNAQGLNGSLITDLHAQKSEKYPDMTLRDEKILEYVLQILNNPANNDTVILALQECGTPFTQALQQALPEHIGIVLSDPGFKGHDQEVVLYSKNSFNLIQQELAVGFYSNPKEADRITMNLTFVENKTGLSYQIINAHVPGNPEFDNAGEFAKYVLTHSNAKGVTIALGDINATDKKMHGVFAEEARKLNILSRFKQWAGYNSHVGTHLDAKLIDHIWIAKRQVDVAIHSLQPDEVLEGLQKTADLLHFCEIAEIKEQAVAFAEEMQKRQQLATAV